MSRQLLLLAFCILYVFCLRSIEHCDTFVVFGSAKYGENTGNSASTYFESKFAKHNNKRIILVRHYLSSQPLLVRPQVKLCAYS